MKYRVTKNGAYEIDHELFEPSAGYYTEEKSKDTAYIGEPKDSAEEERCSAISETITRLFTERQLLRQVIYPRIVEPDPETDPFGPVGIYTDPDANAPKCFFTRIPAGVQSGKMLKWEAAAEKPFSEFSLRARIQAAMNMVELMSVLQKEAGRSIRSIHPEKVMVDVSTGEVVLQIADWFSPYSDIAMRKELYGRSPESLLEEGFVSDEKDLSYFISYALFNLLFMGNPFDGNETLKRFPVLTKNAIRQIAEDGYGFVFSDENNAVNGYFGDRMFKIWQAYPGFLRRAFTREFTVGIKDRDTRMDAEQWLVLVRRVRDCMVLENNQIRLIDPETAGDRKFFQIGQYLIPICAGKGIYWYHVDGNREEGKDGLYAGVFEKNGVLCFSVFTNEECAAWYDDRKTPLPKEACLQLKDAAMNERFCLEINGTVVYAVRGDEIDLQRHTMKDQSVYAGKISENPEGENADTAIIPGDEESEAAGDEEITDTQSEGTEGTADEEITDTQSEDTEDAADEELVDTQSEDTEGTADEEITDTQSEDTEGAADGELVDTQSEDAEDTSNEESDESSEETDSMPSGGTRMNQFQTQVKVEIRHSTPTIKSNIATFLSSKFGGKSGGNPNPKRKK